MSTKEDGRWSDEEFKRMYSLYMDAKSVDDSCSAAEVLFATMPYWEHSWRYINKLRDTLSAKDAEIAELRKELAAVRARIEGAPKVWVIEDDKGQIVDWCGSEQSARDLVDEFWGIGVSRWRCVHAVPVIDANKKEPHE